MDGLNHRLAVLWARQEPESLAEFWRTLNVELVPSMFGWLRRTFDQLEDEDIAVCIDGAIESFVARNDPTIENPASYIRTSARFEAIDLLRAATEPRMLAVKADVAVDMVEDLVPGVEAGQSWAVEVVRAAVTHLGDTQRRVVEHMLSAGDLFNSSQAPAELGMAPGTYRSNASRARKALARHLLDAMVERGLDPRSEFDLEPIFQEHVYALIEDED